MLTNPHLKSHGQGRNDYYSKQPGRIINTSNRAEYDIRWARPLAKTMAVTTWLQPSPKCLFAGSMRLHQRGKDRVTNRSIRCRLEPSAHLQHIFCTEATLYANQTSGDPSVTCCPERSAAVGNTHPEQALSVEVASKIAQPKSRRKRRGMRSTTCALLADVMAARCIAEASHEYFARPSHCSLATQVPGEPLPAIGIVRITCLPIRAQVCHKAWRLATMPNTDSTAR